MKKFFTFLNRTSDFNGKKAELRTVLRFLSQKGSSPPPGLLRSGNLAIVKTYANIQKVFRKENIYSVFLPGIMPFLNMFFNKDT